MENANERSGSRLTIIVIDPEPVVRRVIQHILEREGYAVMPIEDPKAAVEIIKTTSPALVITNVMLPGITGHEAMRMFREAPPTSPC